MRCPMGVTCFGRNNVGSYLAVPAERSALTEPVEPVAEAKAEVAETETVVAKTTMTAKSMPAEAETAVLVPAVEAELAMLQVVTPEAAVIAIPGRLNQVGRGVDRRQFARPKRRCMAG